MVSNAAPSAPLRRSRYSISAAKSHSRTPGRTCLITSARTAAVSRPAFRIHSISSGSLTYRSSSIEPARWCQAHGSGSLPRQLAEPCAGQVPVLIASLFHPHFPQAAARRLKEAAPLLDDLHASGLLPSLLRIARVDPEKGFRRADNGHPRAPPKSSQVEDVDRVGNHQKGQFAPLEELPQPLLPSLERVGTREWMHREKQKGGDSRLLPVTGDWVEVQPTTTRATPWVIRRRATPGLRPSRCSS